MSEPIKPVTDAEIEALKQRAEKTPVGLAEAGMSETYTIRPVKWKESPADGSLWCWTVLGTLSIFFIGGKYSPCLGGISLGPSLDTQHAAASFAEEQYRERLLVALDRAEPSR
jgi:hypothetical protein